MHDWQKDIERLGSRGQQSTMNKSYQLPVACDSEISSALGYGRKCQLIRVNTMADTEPQSLTRKKVQSARGARGIRDGSKAQDASAYKCKQLQTNALILELSCTPGS